MSRTLITDLDAIKRLAAERRDEFDVMRHMLQMDDELTDAEIDARVEAIAAPIIEAIDCRECGNCCRSLDVYLTPTDVERLATGLTIPVEQVITQYVDRKHAQQAEEWGMFKVRPCPFLRGKKCSVYAHRPDSCRSYPAFTPDFRWTLSDTIDGAAVCPIIYNVLSAMVEETDALTSGRGGSNHAAWRDVDERAVNLPGQRGR